MNGLRVVKVGGSLFDFAGLPAALRIWLARQPPMSTVLIAGGGSLADVVRHVQSRFGVSDEDAHWLCIDALSVTARLLAAILPEAELTSEDSSVRAGPLTIFDPMQWMRHERSRMAEALPHDWSVTSDSISAHVATVFGARELVLLKSVTGTSFGKPAAAAEAGYVDSFFPLAAARVPLVRGVNLRDPTDDEIAWKGNNRDAIGRN